MFPGSAPALSQARSLHERGAWADAEREARALLAAVEAAGGGDSLAAADAIDLIVRVSVKLGRERGGDVRALAERALAIRRREQGEAHVDTATSMIGLADVLRRHGDLAGAQPLCENAITIAERDPGPGGAGRADALRCLGNLLYDSGSYSLAHTQFEQVLAILERGLGPDHPDTIAARYNLASALRNLGDLPAAIAGFERSVAGYERAFGASHIRVGQALNNLAIALRQAGDWTAARQRLERSLAIHEAEMGADHPYVAGLLNNLGTLADQLGDRDGARSLWERSLGIRERRLGPEHEDVAQSLNNLAQLLVRQRDFAAARPLAERSVAIRERALTANHPAVAQSLTTLGEALAGLRDLGAARAVHERALEIREKTFGTRHPMAGQSRHALAVAHYLGRDWSAARREAALALDINRQAFGDQHPKSAEAALTLASCLAAAGEASAALDMALNAEEWARSHLLQTAAHLAEGEALDFAAVRVSGRDRALALLAELEATPAERRRVWEAVAGARGLLLDALAERRHSLAAPMDERLAAARAALATATAGLSRAIAGAPGRDPAETRSRLDEARNRVTAAERAVAEASPLAGGGAYRTPTLAEVASELPAGVALLSYVHHGTRPATATAGVDEPARYSALVLRRGDIAPRVVHLGDGATIDALVRTWLLETARGALRSDRGPAAALVAYRKAGRELRRAAWDPLAPALAGADLVLVVPDGALHLVNWATLPVGGHGYLVETGPPIHRLTAERDVLLASRTHPPGAGLLALGGPDYGDRGAGAGPGPRFAPLPGAAQEAEEIAAIWRESAGARGAAAEDPVLLTGAQADEGSFKARAAGRRVLHLATHGMSMHSPGEDGGAGLRGLGGLAPASPAGVLALDEPGGAAGLAFAGANRPDGDEDGILTAAEVRLLDLDAAEWVVLSACDTGIGEMHASEGVIGLERAFRGAGARTVVMSLWPVDDRATRAWMNELYRARLARGESTAEAVRSATRRLLAQRRRIHSSHPFGWGAFVAAGDWR